VVGGGLAGGVAYALSTAANQDEQASRERRAASGTLVLSVRTASTEKRGEAEAIMREAGADFVEARW
jgi:hypothetical protein